MTRAEPFGTLPDGREVQRLTLAGGGLTARLLTYGATVQDLRLDGIDHPLVLGADTLAPYLGPMTYFGAIVGRFANRIAGGSFEIDGQRWQADRNFLGRHTLHGGTEGTGRMIWQIAEAEADRAVFTLDLPDGHMGFPGAMHVRAEIALPGDGALRFQITAQSDAPTPCSFAHHGYFNLDGGADILDHRLHIAAEHYLPVDEELIPTGEIAPVADTPFDFRTARTIRPGGFDHNFCLSQGRVEPRPVATLTGGSGLSMEVVTTEPGLQLYDGAYLDEMTGLDGRRYGPHAGVALETQSWPDAPNQRTFPQWLLRPGETYRHEVTYRFARG